MPGNGESRPPLLEFEFPDGELGSWSTLGDVTDRSVRVWVRAPDGAATATLRIDGATAASAAIATDPAHDHVGAAVLTADPARPGAPFTVEVDGAVRRGRFAPSPGVATAFSFAFGSCHQPYRDPPVGRSLERHAGAGIYPRIGELIREREAGFSMFIGDQVYSDAVSRLSVREILSADQGLSDASLVEVYRHLYRGYFNEAGFRELAEAAPAYLMWDDHDIFDGWGSLLHPTEFDRRLFRAAETAFREYQHLRNPAGSLDDAAPYEYEFWYGNVGFFVPDLRGVRDYESGRILGSEQWDRLDAFLAAATERDVPTVFIATTVPVVHGSPRLMTALEGLPTATGNDIRDRWNVPAFIHEREALLERIFAWQSAAARRQVVILSGDVHVAAAFNVRPRRGGGRLSQWTSSALTTPGGLQHVWANRLVTRMVRFGEKDLRVWRRGLATGNNVGFVEVVPTDGGGHDLTFSVHEYDQDHDRLRVALQDRSSPSG